MPPNLNAKPEKRKDPTKVAQICNLLYRRFAIGRLPNFPEIQEMSCGQQIRNPRYSRLQICAAGLTADYAA
jgi:hypothetical protein